MYRTCKIERTSFPLDGIYNYNAQVWLSLDGKNYYYTGHGKFFRTEAEAIAYKEEVESRKD